MMQWGLAPPQINNFDSIFFSKSKNGASSLCEEFVNSWEENKYIARKALEHLDFFSHIYKYENGERIIIGSANIVSYIGMIVQIIMQNRQYPNQISAKYEIENISRAVLENCPKIIPFWDQLAIPI